MRINAVEGGPAFQTCDLLGPTSGSFLPHERRPLTSFDVLEIVEIHDGRTQYWPTHPCICERRAEPDKS